MNNYPAVLRNYLFLMGIFSTLPNDSEGTRTLSSFSHGSKSGIIFVLYSYSLICPFSLKKLSARDPLVNSYMLTS